MISLILVILVIIYLLFSRIKSFAKLLIFPTVLPSQSAGSSEVNELVGSNRIGGERVAVRPWHVGCSAHKEVLRHGQAVAGAATRSRRDTCHAGQGDRLAGGRRDYDP